MQQNTQDPLLDPNIREVEETRQLTTFTDAGNLSGTPVMEPPRDIVDELSNPYPKQPIQEILSRKYRVATATWNTATAKGALITLSFPDALFAIANVASKLESFQYFRAGVEFEVKVNSTPMHVGALQISYLPFCKEPNQHALHYVQRSGNHSSILSASAANSVKGVIPWINPRKALITTDYYSGEIGMLWVDVLVPLDGAGGTVPDVTVSVFASFHKPEVYGYSQPITPAIHVMSEQEELMEEMKEQFRKENNMGARRTRKPWTRVKIEDPKIQGKDLVTTEAAKAAQKKDESSTGGILQTVKSVVHTADSFLSSEEMQTMIRLASAGASLIGLSKPEVTAPVTPVYNFPCRNLMHTDGVEYSVNMSAAIDAKVDNQVSFVGSDGPNMTILDLIRKPFIVAEFSFNQATAVGAEIFKINAEPSVVWNDGGVPTRTYYPGYLAYVAGFFKYWRGSIKFRFHFFTSAFVTSRVRITHNPTGATIPTIESFGGDVVSEIVDIKGDTIIDITVPYLQSAPYRSVSGFTAPDIYSAGLMSALQVSLLNEVTGMDAVGDMTVYCVVYMAAGEDFRFSRYVNAEYSDFTVDPLMGFIEDPQVQGFDDKLYKYIDDQLYGEIEDPQIQGLDEEFDVPFKGLVPAKLSVEERAVAPEHFGNIRELCHRYSFVGAAGAATEVMVTPFFDPNSYNHNLKAWSRLFLFWRGGIRVATYSASATTELEYRRTFGSTPNDFFSSGYLLSDSETGLFLYGTIPYYVPYLMCPTDTDGVPYNIYSSPAAPLDEFDNYVNLKNGNYGLAAADDFSFIYHASPPKFTKGGFV